MEILGNTRVLARGGTTIHSSVRDRYKLQENDSLDWIIMKAKEFSSHPLEEEWLIARPMRMQPISQGTIQELKETVTQAEHGEALSLADLRSEILVNR